MAKPSPTVRRRRLRSELRRLRAELGLTIEDVQERSGGDIRIPTLSRWETGERSIRPNDLRALLDIYGLTGGEERETLLTLCRQAKERGAGTAGTADGSRRPARVLGSAERGGHPPDGRAERHDASPTGAPGDLAGLPNVTIQVLPFSAGVHPAMDGGFSILGFPDLAADPSVVYLENAAGSVYVEEAAEVDRFGRMFSHIIAKALSPDDSRKLLSVAAASAGHDDGR